MFTPFSAAGAAGIGTRGGCGSFRRSAFFPLQDGSHNVDHNGNQKQNRENDSHTDQADDGGLTDAYFTS